MRAMRVKPFEDTEGRYVTERDWLPDEIGIIAIEMATRWGMIASTQDGEDSAGRQQLRLLTPDELAERAINTAVTLVEKMREKGLVVDCPKYDN